MKINSAILDRLVQKNVIRSYSWRRMPDPDSSKMMVAKTSTECLSLTFPNGDTIFIAPTADSEFGAIDLISGLRVEE